MTGDPTRGPKIEIFFCYSHFDERFRVKIIQHLTILKKQNIIEDWHDRKIPAGVEWEEEISRHLGSARIILLLVSDDFLASYYCFEVEMRRALERHTSGEARVIPIILRPVDWDKAPFGKLQALPRDSRPVTRWRPRDEAYADIARGIRGVVDELTNRLRGEGSDGATHDGRPTEVDARVADPRPGAARERGKDPGRRPGKDFSNPFGERKGILNPQELFARDAERGRLRTYLLGQGNCQIVGPLRIGKTSLLRYVQRMSRVWDDTAAVAYLDMQYAPCHTLAHWLRYAAEQWNWAETPATLRDLASGLEAMSRAGRFAVLCIDEFEGLISRPLEFSQDFFEALRACSQDARIKMSVFTASQVNLNRLADPSGRTAPLGGLFPLIALGPFSARDASRFVNQRRERVPRFSPAERAAILEFAKGHPLALQVACFHVLEAKRDGRPLPRVLEEADEDMRAQLPSWGAPLA